MNKWLSTGYLQSKPTGALNRDKGIIEGALVVTEGEAKGHGVFLESEFVDEVIRQGNESRAGLKARFGHPNMCSTALGTFLGRWKNFRRETVTRDDGSQAIAARADLFLSASAKETPNGDLHDYVLTLAETEGDMFGTSVVFTCGTGYRRTQSGRKMRPVSDDYGYVRAWMADDGQPWDAAADPIIERDYAECDKLHACDCVDDPAANDGMFSRFSKESMAGQITEFLDLHPQVWQAVEKNPEILAALASYGDQIDAFTKRYRDYREHNPKDSAMSNDADASVAAPDSGTPAPVATPENKPEIAADAAPKPDEAKPQTPLAVTPEAPPAPVAPVALVAPKVEPPDARKEFARMKADFGADIAAEIFEAGKGYADAQSLAYKRAKDEAAALRKQLAEVAPASAGTPAAFAPADEKKDVDENGVHRLFKDGTRKPRK